jgi:hypothetical protein
LIEPALQWARSATYFVGVLHLAEIKAFLALTRGDADVTLASLREAVGAAGRVANPGCAAHLLDLVALWAVRRGWADVGETIAGAALWLRRQHAVAVATFERQWRDELGEHAEVVHPVDDLEEALDIAHGALSRHGGS